MSIVRTRFAPSPTGELHIGAMRTILYNYALAKQSDGQFILRIEDTDQKRLVPGAAERQIKDMKDFGLNYDEGPDVGGPFAPYTQSQRLNIYQRYIKQLLDQGHAYYCFCTSERLSEMRAAQVAQKKIPRYDRACRNLSQQEVETKLKQGLPYVIRLKVPDDETISFTDLIRGEIGVNSNEVDDQVLIKSDGIPTYHFAVVVDDHLMEITHVLRADEWLASTPKHVLLYRYFDWQPPQFVHLTALLDPTHKGKMSKRHGSVFARQFLDAGYLPQALLNFLMLLGWNPGTNQEIFTLDEFVKAFSLNKLHKKQPVFDRKKLDYFNGLYIRQKTDKELLDLLRPFMPGAKDRLILDLIPLIKDRIITLKDAYALTRFIYEETEVDVKLFASRNIAPADAAIFLKGARDVLSWVKVWQVPSLQEALLGLIKDKGWSTGAFFMAFRIALANSPVTPPIVDCLPLMGQEKVLSRLDKVLSSLPA